MRRRTAYARGRRTERGTGTMTPTAFTVVATVAAFGLLALCALFVIALARVARDGDEMACEHAAGKRGGFDELATPRMDFPAHRSPLPRGRRESTRAGGCRSATTPLRTSGDRLSPRGRDRKSVV